MVDLVRMKVFSGFERFWHWAQAALIITMIMTGFEVNGTWQLLGYETAANTHRLAALSLIVLWVLGFFWMTVTGEWRHYRPTKERFIAVIRFYSVEIFNPNAEHPYHPTTRAKHNPVQRLAYLGFLIGITPLIWISGLLYMFYNDWPSFLGPQGLGLSLEIVATIHLAAAFGLLIFLVGHIYMVFTCRPLTKYVKAMITGYEAVEKAD